uniref:thioredoxin domain-containing protein n=1 Tax=Sulfurihydrogenibium sp. TaxID=2053621 RepID=UPI002604038A
IVYYLLIKTLENQDNEKLLKKTLYGYEKLIDKEEGGIFRYATKRDWTQPHYEKLLRDQAILSVAFFNGYSVLKDKRFLEDANSILDFVKNTLYDKKRGYFYGSQGADIVDENGKILVSGEIYFSKKREDRRFLENVYRKKLPLDETFYFSENALMVKTLAYSYVFNGNFQDLNIAENLMKKIIKEGLKEKGIIHTPSINRYFLDTQINTLESLFTLYQITGNDFYLQNFQILLNRVLKNYYSEKIGLFTDYEDTGLNLNRISYIDSLISLNFKLAKIIYEYQLLYDDKILENLKNSIIKKLVNFKSVESGLSVYLYFKPPIFSISVNPEKEFNNIIYSFFPYWNIPFRFSPTDKTFVKLGYPYEGYPVVYICSLQICFEKLKKSDISYQNLKNIFEKYLKYKTM